MFDRNRRAVASLGLVLLVAACNPFAPKIYRSMAVVAQAGEFDGLSAAQESLAVRRVQSLAASERKPGREITVEATPGTGIIKITVLAESARDAADTCNRIADAFVAGSKGKAQIIMRGGLPTEPVN